MAITIKDVARAAGVSPATVSLVLNNKTQRVRKETVERVRRTAKELDYVVNRQAQWLQSQKSHLLALLVPDLQNDFYSQVAVAAMEVAQESGYLLTVWSLPKGKESLRNLERILKSGEFAGSLVVSRRFDIIRHLWDSSLTTPCVFLDETVAEDMQSYLVTGDNEFGGRLVAKHFLERGHRHFACITGPEETPNSTRRLSGFLKEINDHGLELSPSCIEVGDYTAEGGYRAAKLLLQQDFTALFALNDLTAMGAIRAFWEEGYSVPEDISVIGYDNIDLGRYWLPRLTTVNQHPKEIGRVGTKQLLEMIDNGQTTGRYLVAPTLVPGASVRDLTKKK